MRTICIDIDGTISHYIEWVDAKTFGEVLPHCAETIHHLKADGWYVIIYTTRADKKEIISFLESNNIPFDAINENPNQPDNAKGGKPFADVYVDDRAIQFDGDWQGTYGKIISFTSWEEGSLNPIAPPLDYCSHILAEDFSQSIEMHRHYDSMNWQITKFAFGEILIAIGACWTVFSLENTPEAMPNLNWIAMCSICFASWLFGILSLYTITKNRRYFVRNARHINELRYHVLQRKPYGFANDAHFWDDPTYPKVRDLGSTHFVSYYMLSALTVLMSFGTVYAYQMLYQYNCVLGPIVAVIITIIISLLIVVFVAKDKF